VGGPPDPPLQGEGREREGRRGKGREGGRGRIGKGGEGREGTREGMVWYGILEFNVPLDTV